MAQPKNKGEWYLTDAFQYMVEHGAKLKVAEAAGWYDAGQVDTIIATNGVMLEQRPRTGEPARTLTARSSTGIYRRERDADGLDDRAERFDFGGHEHFEFDRARLDHRPEREDRQLRARRSLVGDHAVISRVKGTVSMGEYSEAKGTE